MTYNFAALCFTEDENIADKVYWYLCEFPVKVGDRVLAPVGMHNRLQAARVEQTLSSEEKDAPYDVRFLKCVAAKYGARKLIADGVVCLEFGGVRYDNKHFTPYGRLLYAEFVPESTEELEAYGVTECLEGDSQDAAIYEKIAASRGCALLGGERGEEIFKNLFSLVRGANKPLYDIGVSQKTIARLEEKLR